MNEKLQEVQWELPNQEKIRTLGGKETYKNLGILEADTIKKNGDERKKMKKEYLRKPNYIAKISSKG